MDYLRLPLRKASQNRIINDIDIFDRAGDFDKIKKTIMMNYKKAPQFETVYALLEEIFAYPADDLIGFLEHQIRCVCRYLDIDTEIYRSSAIPYEEGLKAEERIIGICKELGCTEYYNAIGGQELYNREHFTAEGMKLWFLKADFQEYSQGLESFEPGLSIIDVMMFNPKETVKDMLKQFTLV